MLGTFTYAYDGVTSRVDTVTYPNGQTSAYSYLPTAQDHRLQTIHHRHPNGTTLSKFDSTYDAVGNILTWQQEDADPAVLWTYGYDEADQLTSALKQTTGASPTVLQRYGYGYDPGGNRTFERIGDQVTTATHGELNRLLAHAPGGPLQFAGTVNEPATVSIQGVLAAVDGNSSFKGSPALSPGSGTVSIVAVDASGNQSTQQYQLDVTGSAKTFMYDANGNLTSDGTRTFEWDARNQLVAVNVGTHRSEFTYDGKRRRVRVIEKENGVTQVDTKVVWCEEEICEELAADGLTVTRRLVTLGEQVAGAPHYFTADHLGSVGEVTDNSSAVLARYVYDPWGRRTVTTGADVTTVGFTGHRRQAAAGLWLTLHRAYDPELGRWLTDDPLGLQDGPNLYAYVRGRVISAWDPLGLQASGGGGGSCCDELKARRRRLHDILDSLETGKALNPPGGPPYGLTNCYPDGSSDAHVLPHTPPCLRDCVAAHERRHQRQCRRTPGAIGSERSAYLVELGCVIRKINEAKCCSSQ